MTSFFPCLQSMHAFSLNPTSACQHCGLGDHLVSHGFVYQKLPLRSPVRVGKRLLCSNRSGRRGCGHTVRLYLANVIPRLHYSASVIMAFLLALNVGRSVVIAFQQATGRTEARQAWRWVHRLHGQLPRWRSRFLRHSCTTAAASLARVADRSARVQVVLSTFSALVAGEAVTSCADLQRRWQSSFC